MLVKTPSKIVTDTYDLYDRAEDEALLRLRDTEAMSDEETDAEDTPGCDPLESVVWMLRHFEENHDWETSWDDRHEDWYFDGEMTSWRRFTHPKAGMVTFKFVEDKGNSFCRVSAKEWSRIVYTKEAYMDVLEHTLNED